MDEGRIQPKNHYKNNMMMISVQWNEEKEELRKFSRKKNLEKTGANSLK